MINKNIIYGVNIFLSIILIEIKKARSNELNYKCFKCIIVLYLV